MEDGIDFDADSIAEAAKDVEHDDEEEPPEDDDALPPEDDDALSSSSHFLHRAAIAVTRAVTSKVPKLTKTQVWEAQNGKQ